MNHFMERLIFCSFAENTGILSGKNLFSDTMEQMSARMPRICMK
ncbi:type IIL restriction-modification enzyme MmeI [Bacillus sp. FJAT-29937]